jgi:broad specificity phosphatase PhoE
MITGDAIDFPLKSGHNEEIVAVYWGRKYRDVSDRRFAVAVTTFILIRHGETLWTRERRYQGITDIPLAEDAKKDVLRAAGLIKELSADYLYTSPLLRARQTADIISQTIGKKPVCVDDLREVSFGVWEGKTANELIAQKDPTYLKWMQTRRWTTPSKGESLRALEKRVMRFWEGCLVKHRNQKIAVAAHGGSLKMLLLSALKMRRDDLFRIKMDPCSISIVRDHDGWTDLVCLNVRTSNGRMSII